MLIINARGLQLQLQHWSLCACGAAADVLKSRDSSIKRNNALLKRLRALSEDTKEGVLADIQKVNQSKVGRDDSGPFSGLHAFHLWHLMASNSRAALPAVCGRGRHGCCGGPSQGQRHPCSCGGRHRCDAWTDRCSSSERLQWCCMTPMVSTAVVHAAFALLACRSAQCCTSSMQSLGGAWCKPLGPRLSQALQRASSQSCGGAPCCG